MRHYIKYLFICSMLFLANSCKKALDLSPVAVRTADGFMNDPKNAIEAVNACYYQMFRLQEFHENNHAHDYFFGDLTTFDSQIGSTPNDFADLQRLTEWTMNNTNVPTRTLWSVGYQGVHNANYVLTSLPDATLDANLKSRLMGEAYFSRGYWYLRFATSFGNVPIVTTRLSTTDFKDAKQGTMHDAFEQAVADFKKAAEFLPEKSAYSSSDLGRATKGAARGFLARTLMYQIGFDKENKHTWQEVLEETTKIINSTQYSLTPNYAAIFETEGENNNESVFELQASFGNAETTTEAIGSHSPTCQGVRTNNLLNGTTTIVWGWGYNNATQDLVNEFEVQDPRLSSTVFGKPINNGIIYGTAFNYDIGTEWTPYHNRKVAKTAADAAGGWWRNGNNIRLMRYAEILLIQAEALYNTGNEATARTYLNIIRNRARNSTFARGYELNKPNEYKATGFVGNLPDVTASGINLLRAIKHERRVELGMESHRYYDLVRWGDYISELTRKRALAYAPYQAVPVLLAYTNIDLPANALKVSIDGPGGNKIPLLPIPQIEADIWSIKQNPGY